MTKRHNGYLVRVLVPLGLLVLMTGCDITTNSVSPVDLANSSLEVTLFIQQFAREVLAAFLF